MLPRGVIATCRLRPRPTRRTVVRGTGQGVVRMIALRGSSAYRTGPGITPGPVPLGPRRGCICPRSVVERYLISIWRVLACSDLGISILSTPSLKAASIFSKSTSPGKVIDRVNLPQKRSLL